MFKFLANCTAGERGERLLRRAASELNVWTIRLKVQQIILKSQISLNERALARLAYEQARLFNSYGLSRIKLIQISNRRQTIGLDKLMQSLDKAIMESSFSELLELFWCEHKVNTQNESSNFKERRSAWAAHVSPVLSQRLPYGVR